MKIVGLPILHQFCNGHRDCTQQVSSWIAEAKEAEWNTPSDIKQRYVSASFLRDNHVVFNIKGNKYRIDTKIYYQQQTIIVERAGTHEEYAGWRF